MQYKVGGAKWSRVFTQRITKVKDEPEDPSDLYALSHDDEGKGHWGRWSAHQHTCVRGHLSSVRHVKHHCRFVLQEKIKLDTDTRSTFGLIMLPEVREEPELSWSEWELKPNRQQLKY